MERHISSSNHTMITSCPPSPSSGCALTYLSSTVFFYITSEKHKTLEHVVNPSSVLWKDGVSLATESVDMWRNASRPRPEETELCAQDKKDNRSVCLCVCVCVRAHAAAILFAYQFQTCRLCPSVVKLLIVTERGIFRGLENMNWH